MGIVTTQSSYTRRKKRKIGPPLSPVTTSNYLLLQIAPDKVGMFRFLLEAYEHIAYFSVINKQKAILKIVYSPHRESAAKQMLSEIGESLEIEHLPWRFSQMLNS